MNPNAARILTHLQADERQEYPPFRYKGIDGREKVVPAGVNGPGCLTAANLARDLGLTRQEVGAALTALRRAGLVAPSVFRLLDLGSMHWAVSAWSPVIVGYLKDGPRTGAELARLCTGKADKTGAVKGALEELATLGIIDPPAMIYLTDEGRALCVS